MRQKQRFSSTALHPAPRMMLFGLNVTNDDDDVVVDEDDVVVVVVVDRSRLWR